MSRLAILADDFTGACDAAAPFASAGQRTRVLLSLPETWPADLDVLAVDLDVRERSPGAAYAA
ncbi:MAG: four-carbon acid sugar kinase family protein, partial [Chloroflexota bacterium]|nr:four-carbon acid sugar kinase family protein [Chloroflexota bacterium]